MMPPRRHRRTAKKQAPTPQQARNYAHPEADAAQRLARISRPFLNWAGKAERLSFDVLTLPLFVHEPLSTRDPREREASSSQYVDGRVRTLRRSQAQLRRSTPILRAPRRLGESHDTRRSLVAINSLLQYKGMGGHVQMICIDPPYAVKFGSNFQPLVRKRSVENNDDDDMTREPEMWGMFTR